MAVICSLPTAACWLLHPACRAGRAGRAGLLACLLACLQACRPACSICSCCSSCCSCSCVCSCCSCCSYCCLQIVVVFLDLLFPFNVSRAACLPAVPSASPLELAQPFSPQPQPASNAGSSCQPQPRPRPHWPMPRRRSPRHRSHGPPLLALVQPPARPRLVLTSSPRNWIGGRWPPSSRRFP